MESILVEVYTMLRDFSDEKKSELKNAVEAAEASGFWKIIDWVQDRSIKEKISDYSGDIADYHRNIIDKKDTTLQQLDAIFSDVYTVEMRYEKTFTTAHDRIIAISDSISSIADILDPSPADGGGLVLLRPQSVLNSMFDPIKEVVESEAFYQTLRESKNSDEMFITSVGVIYKGELYPFTEIGPVEITEGQQFTHPMKLVHSNVLDDAKFNFC